MSMKPYSGEVDEKDVATHRRWIKQCYAIYGYVFIVICGIGMLCDISFGNIVSFYLVIILPKFAIGTVHLPTEAQYRSLKTAHNRLYDTLSGGFAHYVRYSQHINVEPQFNRELQCVYCASCDIVRHDNYYVCNGCREKLYQ